MHAVDYLSTMKFTSMDRRKRKLSPSRRVLTSNEPKKARL